MSDPNTLDAPSTTPADMADVTGGAPAPDLGQPQTAAPQAPPKPSLWKDVLAGALAGLAGSAGAKHFGSGLAGGVAGEMLAKQQQLENQQAQAAQASRIKFQDAQTAAAVADAKVKDQELHEMPQDAQDRHNANAAKVVDLYTSKFNAPTAVVNNTGPDAMSHLETLSAAQPGGVDHHIIVNTGDKLYLWNTAAAANSDNALPFVTSAGDALGVAPLAQMTPDAWKALPSAKKVQAMDMADDLYNTIVPGKDLGTMGGQLSRLGQAQQTLQKKVNSNPALRPLLDNVNRNLSAVQTAHDKQKQDKADLAKVAGESRGAAYNEAKTKDVLKADGVHIMAWDPTTKDFTRDQGLAGTGAQGNRGAAASSSVRMGEDLIADIQANKESLGGLSAWVKKYGLNTPVADPKLAQIQAELSSFAALQPVQHGFRSTSALETFEKLIGGLQKNPEATIATIRGLQKTSGAINPAISGATSQPAQQSAEPTATGPNGHKIVFRGGKWIDPQTGAAIQ